MLNSFKNLFGFGSKVNYKELIANGAKVIDVRTKGEYASGHVSGSINIPLNELSSGIKKLNKDTVLITCCASGIRSASAKSSLKAMGFSEVHNGGGWMSLNTKL
jgi:phage shock protein E